MKKNLLLRLCLILLVAITVYSCRTDQFPESQPLNDSSKFQLSAKTISLNQSKHKTMLSTELEKAKTEFKNTTKGQTYGKYGGDIIVDTENVIYIENGPNYHTYTFHLKRENAAEDAPLENLVLSPLTDGTYRQLLFTYHITPQEKQTLVNEGYLETKEKIEITELGSVSHPGVYQKNQICNWQTITTDIPCKNGHRPGQKCNLTGNQRPYQLTESFYICEEGYPGEGGGPGDGGPGGGSGGCSPNGALTGPQVPNDGMGMNPCEGGIPSIPNPGGGFLPPIKDPCAKTKALLEDPAVKAKIDSLEKKSQTIGEKGFLYMKDNTTSEIIGGGDHEVNFTPYTGYKGIYHNHTPAGTYMLSVEDIVTMCKTAVFKLDAATAKDAFVGMVAKETCNCPPDNFVYHNYLLRFNGDFPKAIAIAYSTQEQKSKFEDDYTELKMKLLGNPLLRNSPSIAANLNSQGLEQLLFGILAKMNITPDQVVLQKIEKNGTVNNVNLNPDGSTSYLECP